MDAGKLLLPNPFLSSKNTDETTIRNGQKVHDIITEIMNKGLQGVLYNMFNLATISGRFNLLFTSRGVMLITAQMQK